MQFTDAVAVAGTRRLACSELQFGPEIFEEVDADWKAGITES
jgi:hypothetical protein